MNDPTAWFGKHNADFITLHVDPGVRVKTLFGERELLLAQGMAFWIRGDGTLDDKTVEETWTVTPVRQPPRRYVLGQIPARKEWSPVIAPRYCRPSVPPLHGTHLYPSLRTS